MNYPLSIIHFFPLPFAFFLIIAYLSAQIDSKSDYHHKENVQ